MKKILAFVLAALMLAALCACGGGSAPAGTESAAPVSTAPTAAGNDAESGESKDAPASELPASFEIAATEPHYFVATPDWNAEGYGCGFALTEGGSKDYAIVVACGYGGEEGTLEEVVTALYNDTFHGILMQNYRAKYAELRPAFTETMLADGTPALCFEEVQPADDYGTELSCPVYGYAFRCGDTPFIVASVVMNGDAVDDAKRAEMQGYVVQMAESVRATE